VDMPQGLYFVTIDGRMRDDECWVRMLVYMFAMGLNRSSRAEQDMRDASDALRLNKLSTSAICYIYHPHK